MPTTSWHDASLWSRALGHDTYAPVRADRSVDVVVIGGGITGLLTATLLADSGADVLVVERHDIGGVATRNTTAKVSALQGTTCSTIRSARDADVAGAYVQANLHAVDGMRQLIRRLAIDCALTDAPAYTYATEPGAAHDLQSELAAALDAGLDVTWVESTELPFPVAGAVRLEGQAHVDAGALCAGLARHLGAGAIAEHTAVLDVDESEASCTVTTANDATITADHVVVATQGPVVDPARLANRCTPNQSYCLSAQVEGPVPVGMYLSCDSETRSLRPAIEDDHTVLVVGGAGHRVGDVPERPPWETLTEWTEAHFGRVAITHRWGTHDLTPTDHVPFIGRLGSGSSRRWVATGFAKWGMTNGYVAAHVISEAIGGRAVEWAGAFDSTRIAASVNRELLAAGVHAAKHLVADRISHRDAPRCTHQGCVLRLDESLDTWACPCHGSRFGRDGAVIQGPATTPVELA
jgi:glycine/D-amino acid oxidase-like deaminating enzyme